jgi:drug/metabolite transporter (DMT)-like permease
MLSYVLAVLAACANATSSVLQRKANREVPRKHNLSWRLIWSLLHQPVWFFGILAITAGFLLQATALGFGQLSSVEPILVLELPLTLILASRVFGQRMRRREWGSAAAMTAGLGALLYLLMPSAGRSSSVRWYVWLIGIGANLALVAVLVALGRRASARGRGSGYRAALLGVAAGSTFGLTAALMKGMTTTFTGGFGTLVTSWQIYGMIAAGGLGMFFVQSALNAGNLLAAQPGLTLADPVLSILWGVLAFHERVRGGWFVLPEAACLAVMAAAVITLARSPLLSDSGQDAAKAARDGGKSRQEGTRSPRQGARSRPGTGSRRRARSRRERGQSRRERGQSRRTG